ncbi:hypothetical protein [Paenibacillus senegalensis]|uniref:hypothetical protein n=1 Tax=Paenibacillus senegalensis TaxID=1465766 RepID=UPI0002889740|nr:hypothetical protein [Paenibacillus senegalensis]
MKLFYSKDNGTVSVYLIIILVPIFLFHAVLLDYARVKIAEREVEAALRAANRSVFAGFNKQLQSYGLFAAKEDKESQSQLFRNVLEYNLTPSGNEYFRYLDTRLASENSRIQPLYTLGNHVIFQQQILEDMKYKAPLEFVSRILEPFKQSGALTGLEQTSNYYEKAELLEELIQQWHRDLDAAWDETVRYNHQAAALYDHYSGKLSELQELAAKIGLHTVESVTETIRHVDEQISRAVDNLESLARDEETLLSALASLVQGGEGQAEAIRSISQSLSSVRQSIRDLNRHLAELRERKMELDQLLKDLLAYGLLISQTRASLEYDYSLLEAEYEKLMEKIEQARQVNEQLREEKEQVLAGYKGSSDAEQQMEVFQLIPVYPLEFFSLYKAGGAQVNVKFQMVKRVWQNTALFTGNSYAEVADALSDFQQSITDFHQQQELKEEERQELKAVVETHQEEEKQKVGSVLAELKQALDFCAAEGGNDRYSGYYRTLTNRDEEEQGLYAKYYDYNSDHSALPDEWNGLGGVEDSIKESMSIGKRLANVLTDFRDELYMNEYALTKFNYRTIDKEKLANEQPAAALEPSKPLQHPLKNQEAEYILYGLSSCALNHSAAYGEMFIVLMALRTVETMQKPDKALLNLGSPFLVLLASAAQGAVDAYSDMKKLIGGQKVPVIKKFKNLTVGYKDMLRIFYLLHSKDDKVLSRMQALIELNTNLDLTEHMTYMQSTASATIRLWFMPGAVKMMNGLGIVDCEPVGNRCQISKTAVMSY